MGIVNVTPDSFSDGGRFLEADAAIEHGRAPDRRGSRHRGRRRRIHAPGRRARVSGGGASPGAAGVEGIAAADWGPARPLVSIDTSKAPVARAALEAGASLVNDVSAFRADPQMAGLVADSGAECCLMHMLGEPRTMQEDPRYEDVVDEVKAFLEERLAFAVREGVSEQRVLLDPGIGFGKTVEHNLELLRRLDEL